MRTVLLGISLILALATALGCSMGSSEPPKPTITAGKLVVPAVLSSHCWGNRCADYADPPTQLKNAGYQPAVVPAGASLAINFATPPKGGELTIHQWVDGQAKTLTPATKNAIVLPTEPGVYTYHVAANWMGGSASYAFQVEVR